MTRVGASQCKHAVVPGWTEHVHELHSVNMAWCQAGVSTCNNFAVQPEMLIGYGERLADLDKAMFLIT